MRLFSAFICMLGLPLLLSAQSESTSCWTPVERNNVTLPETAVVEFEPLDYFTYTLDYDALVKNLERAPLEFSAGAQKGAVRVKLPNAQGQLESFALVESPVMESRLWAENRQTRTFSGYSLQTPGKTLRCMYSPTTGFRAMVMLPDKGVEYIEPLARRQFQYYRVYDRKTIPAELYPKHRGTVEISKSVQDEVEAFHRAMVPPAKPADRGAELALVTVKEYRFALSATHWFCWDHDTLVDKVFDHIVNYTNLLNGFYERDLAIRFKLVNDEKKLIFPNAATDPFAAITSTGGWMNKNTEVVNLTIGSSSYDVGHVVSRNLDDPTYGVAGGTGIICTPAKARGCTTGGSTGNTNIGYGDFFMGIMGQEIGHQFDGGHTWTHCGGPGDFPGSACEPGSGSTIMSYAGLCGPDDNVVNFGQMDLYFNACSIVEIRRYVELGGGSVCANLVQTTNNNPTVSLSYPNNFYIPIRTPFELKGTASDPDGDALTYCWEEIDAGPLVPLGSPSGNTAVFRTYPPTTNPARTFPKMTTIVTNQTDKRELLPTYTRDFRFALTARDNKAGGGGVQLDTMKFKATDLAGPFTVTYPSAAGAVWNQGDYEVVTWDVANTDKAPVNCKKVNIRLSLNSGQAFPIDLAVGVPNIGRACVKVPAVTSGTARVRVEAADNIFFDISNTGLKIQAPTTPGFTFCPGSLTDVICLPAKYSTVIGTSATGGFSDSITLTLSGLPAGVTADISPNPVPPGSDAVLTLDVPGSQPEGSFDLKIFATAAGLSDSTLSTLSVYYNDFTGFGLLVPYDGAVAQDQAPTLTWNTVANANTYEVQVAASPSFAPGTIVASQTGITTGSYKVPILLEKGKVFYWRVRAVNECGAGLWTESRVFSTLIDVCKTYASNDVPKSITASGITTVESKLNINGGGIVSDVNITKIQGQHEFFKDLEMHLISPLGTDVLLFKDKCPGSNATFNFGFDDSKAVSFGCPPPNNGTTYKPVDALSAMNNQNAAGLWTLRVKDNAVSSGGSISAFELELCSSTTLNPPMLINNNPLSLPSGTNREILPDLLKTVDANNTDDQLVYTLVTLPQAGELQKFWTGKMQVGDQFTQTDLNNGGLRYFDYGGSGGVDEFCFTVTDGEGGLIKDCFHIQPVVGVHEADRALDFALMPNPATETVRIAFPTAADSDTHIRLFDTSGRLLHSTVLSGGETTTLLRVADLPPGLYAVSVSNARGRGMQKLIVE